MPKWKEHGSLLNVVVTVDEETIVFHAQSIEQASNDCTRAGCRP